MGLLFSLKAFSYPDIESYIRITDHPFNPEEISLLHIASLKFHSFCEAIANDKKGTVVSEFRSMHTSQEAMMGKAVSR